MSEWLVILRAAQTSLTSQVSQEIVRLTWRIWALPLNSKSGLSCMQLQTACGALEALCPHRSASSFGQPLLDLCNMPSSAYTAKSVKILAPLAPFAPLAPLAPSAPSAPCAKSPCIKAWPPRLVAASPRPKDTFEGIFKSGVPFEFVTIFFRFSVQRLRTLLLCFYEQAHHMEDQGHSHSGSPGLPAKKAKTMNLQKCDFCRKRKVRVSNF